MVRLTALALLVMSCSAASDTATAPEDACVNDAKTTCEPPCPAMAQAVDAEPTIRGSVTLRNGVELPLLGFGTAGLMGGTRAAVASAVAAGFRAFDTAQAPEWCVQTNTNKQTNK